MTSSQRGSFRNVADHREAGILHAHTVVCLLPRDKPAALLSSALARASMKRLSNISPSSVGRRFLGAIDDQYIDGRLRRFHLQPELLALNGERRWGR